MGRPVVVRRRWLTDFPPPNPQPTNCVLWQGAVDRDGYGVLTRGEHNDRKRFRAHRWIWETANGKIPPGMVVRHKCDNRLCYRLSHLELGTVAENNEDARQRGHLGPALSVPPSQLREIFDAWDDWGGSMRGFHAEHFPDIPLTTLRRLIKRGRSDFPDIFPEYAKEADDGRTADGSDPAESLPGQRDGGDRAARDLASWRRRDR